MRKYMLVTLLLVVGVCATFAQKKSVSEAKSAANQEKPDYVTAEKLIKEALENDETKNDAKTWNTAGFIFNKKFEDERNKKLLKQKFDEKTMYSALYDAYNYWLKCIAIDNLPDAKGKIKPKFEKDIKEKIKENVNEFINAGAYFYDQKDYKLAYHYFDAYNQAGAKEELKSLKIGTDTTLRMIPYYACLSALNMNDDQTAINALEFAKKTDYERYRIYYFLAEAYKKTSQKEKYMATLNEGYGIFSDSLYFIGNLINNYIINKDFDNASKFLKEAISRKPSDNLYIALGEVYQESKKSDTEIKTTFEEAIKLNPMNAQAYYYIGRIYFNKAVDLSNTASEIKDNKKYLAAREKTKGLYKDAMPYFKKAAEISPESVEYMIPLRSIYYNLNLSKDFDVIDKKISAKQKK